MVSGACFSYSLDITFLRQGAIADFCLANWLYLVIKQHSGNQWIWLLALIVSFILTVVSFQLITWFWQLCLIGVFGQSFGFLVLSIASFINWFSVWYVAFLCVHSTARLDNYFRILGSFQLIDSQCWYAVCLVFHSTACLENYLLGLLAVYIIGFSLWNAMVLCFHWIACLENYLLWLMAVGFQTIWALCYVCSGLLCCTLSVVTFCLSQRGRWNQSTDFFSCRKISRSSF